MGNLISVWIGWDPREAAAFAVARESLILHSPSHWPIRGLLLAQLQGMGLYCRELEYRASAVDRPIMWDVPSDAPMSTQHANARFFVPHIAKRGWALFLDGDMLVRRPIGDLAVGLDNRFAVYCVKHNYTASNSVKMDNQIQTLYSRKNWSSFLLFNCDHPSNKKLTLEMLNTLPGRDLHRFCWLDDDEIGELDSSYNYLVGETTGVSDPKVVHFTNGIPDMRGYENVEYADEWRMMRDLWARGTIDWPM